MWLGIYIFIYVSNARCIWSCVLNYASPTCEHLRVRSSVCVCVLWPKKKNALLCGTNHEASFSPIDHNKEQLNAAALPAEEPTAGRTSTNRQICIKPRGRSNKRQPTGSDPHLPPTKKKKSPSDDSNQKVTGCLATPDHSLSPLRPFQDVKVPWLWCVTADATCKKLHSSVCC